MKENNKFESEPMLHKNETHTLLPIRYIIVFMCFLAVTLNYATRMTLSVAMLAMVPKGSMNLTSSNVSMTSDTSKHLTFDWSLETQQFILGSLYYGNTITPFFAGWLVGIFGGSPIILLGTLLMSLMMLLTPVAAEVGVWLLVITRIVDGMGQGFVYPATFNLITNWSKLNERNTFISISASGVVGILWCIGWCIVGSTDVNSNRWISTIERDSILFSQTEEIKNASQYEVPWKKIAQSPVVWTLCFCTIGFNFGFIFLLTELPIFFETILGFELKMTGLLSTIPHFVFFVAMLFGGVLADALIFHKILTAISTRKLLACCALGISPMFLVSIGYVANNETLAVVLMICVFGMCPLYIPSVEASILDIAPNHSGLLIGIMSSASHVCGFIAPAIVGILTRNCNTIYQWRKMFWITAGVQVLGLVTFMIFGTSEVQEWSKLDKSDTDEVVPCIESEKER
ncbi:sialin-like isoform X2 [Antedon mediterranea]|uniref:sialin-like isoform X2 n=1 Tax=Antedon mediterranea TaxID=105859 RepID=UPI003AF79E8F